MPNRRLASILAAVLLVASAPVVAQSPDPEGGAASPAVSPDSSPPGAPDAGSELGTMPASGDLKVFGFGGETGDLIATTRTARFRELYPDVNVSFDTDGWDEQTFLSSLNSSDPPDVVNIPRNIAGTYIDRGVLLPLDECIAASGADMSVFQESALAQLTVDGQVFGFPQFYNTRLWFIDDAVFEEAGLDPATFDFSDREAIASANEAMTRVENGRITRLGIDPKLPEFLPLWARANGVGIIADDGLTSQLDDPAVADVLEFTASLHEPAGGRAGFLDFRDTWDFFGANNEFVQHQVGAFPMEQWYLNVLAENSPDISLTVRPFVTSENEPITWADGDAFAIVASTDAPEAACAWGHVMTDAETWVRAAEARAADRAERGLPHTGVYTANRVADERIVDEILDLSEMGIFGDAVQVVLDTQDSAFGLPPSPAGAQFEQAWRSAVDEVLTGGTPAAEALAAADAEAQAAIDEAASR